MRFLKRHGPDFLKAVGQSYFLDDPWFGLGFLVLLGAFGELRFAYGLAGALFGYAHSVRSCTPKSLKVSGLSTVNGLFFGIAMASFFRQSPAFFVLFLLGILCLPLITKAAQEVFQHWKLSPLVLPYIVMIWVIWLGAGAAELTPRMETPMPPSLACAPVVCGQALLQATFRGMGRTAFIPSPIFGGAILVLIAAFRARQALFFFAGTLMATGLALVLFSQTAIWNSGYLGFCAGLVGLGLASFPERIRPGAILGFCAATAVVTMAIDHLMLDRPFLSLSLPYAMTLWLALLSRAPKINLEWAPLEPRPRILVAVPALQTAPAKEREAAA